MDIFVKKKSILINGKELVMLASIYNKEVKNWNEKVLTSKEIESTENKKAETTTVKPKRELSPSGNEIFRREFENDSIIECF
ncbi:MAG TPA: hypothetical protein DCX92_08305 [Bacteroidetes bacterium]|nr:hypothetical protein [Bacteroidota bacterium]